MQSEVQNSLNLTAENNFIMFYLIQSFIQWFASWFAPAEPEEKALSSGRYNNVTMQQCHVRIFVEMTNF